MYNVKDVIKSAICGFHETVHEQYDLDVEEFLKSMDYYLVEETPEYYFENSDLGYEYDIDSLKTYRFKQREIDTAEATSIAYAAFEQTINVDKTINIEAFVDNLIKMIRKK